MFKRVFSLHQKPPSFAPLQPLMDEVIAEETHAHKRIPPPMRVVLKGALVYHEYSKPEARDWNMQQALKTDNITERKTFLREAFRNTVWHQHTA